MGGSIPIYNVRNVVDMHRIKNLIRSAQKVDGVEVTSLTFILKESVVATIWRIYGNDRGRPD